MSTVLEQFEIESMYDSIRIKWVEVNFPIEHVNHDQFLFESNEELYTFAESGLEYIAYRFSKYDDSLPKKNQDIDNFKKYEQDLNAASIARCEDGLEGRFILAVNYYNYIVGILSNYSPVTNLEISKLIRCNNLSSLVVSYSVKLHRSEVYLSNTDTKDYFGVKIVNGQTGRTSLNYQSFFKVDGYEYDFKTEDRTRHLENARLFEVIEGINTVIEESKAIELDSRLSRMSGLEAIGILESKPRLTKKQQEVVGLSSGSTALDIAIDIASNSAIHGYKGAVKGLLDYLVEKVMDLPRATASNM